MAVSRSLGLVLSFVVSSLQFSSSFLLVECSRSSVGIEGSGRGAIGDDRGFAVGLFGRHPLADTDLGAEPGPRRFLT